MYNVSGRVLRRLQQFFFGRGSLGGPDILGKPVYVLSEALGVQPQAEVQYPCWILFSHSCMRVCVVLGVQLYCHGG